MMPHAAYLHCLWHEEDEMHVPPRRAQIDTSVETPASAHEGLNMAREVASVQQEGEQWPVVALDFALSRLAFEFAPLQVAFEIALLQVAFERALLQVVLEHALLQVVLERELLQVAFECAPLQVTLESA